MAGKDLDELCDLGHHVWAPWLQLSDWEWLTWCLRCKRPYNRKMVGRQGPSFS